MKSFSKEDPTLKIKKKMFTKKSDIFLQVIAHELEHNKGKKRGFYSCWNYT